MEPLAAFVGKSPSLSGASPPLPPLPPTTLSQDLLLTWSLTTRFSYWLLANIYLVVRLSCSLVVLRALTPSLMTPPPSPPSISPVNAPDSVRNPHTPSPPLLPPPLLGLAHLPAHFRQDFGLSPHHLDGHELRVESAVSQQVHGTARSTGRE